MTKQEAKDYLKTFWSIDADLQDTYYDDLTIPQGYATQFEFRETYCVVSNYPYFGDEVMEKFITLEYVPYEDFEEFLMEL